MCIQLKPDAVEDDIIKAYVILHNFVLKKKPLLMEEQDMQNNLHSVVTPARRSKSTAVNRMHDHFVEYFLSRSGWLDWQDNQI